MSEAKDYLLRISRLDSQINGKLKHRDAIREQLTRITPVMSDGGGSGGGFHDRMADGVAKLADLEKEIDRDVDRLVDMKRKTISILDRLTNPRYYTVLHDRYVLGKTWSHIAWSMDISEQGVYKIHGRALQVFEKLMREE